MHLIMKIKHLELRNFRGISHAKIDIESFTTLIGPNNIGKSTILNAIHILLDNKKPKLEDWPNQSLDCGSLEIICIFDQLEDWEREKPAISNLLFNDQLIVRVLCVATDEGESYSWEYSVYYLKEMYPTDGVNITAARRNETLNRILNELGIGTANEYRSRMNDINEHIKIHYPDMITSKKGWHEKKFANSLQQAVPHVMYVPASFKIQDDLKATSSSPFSFLFKNKLFPLVRDDESYTEYMSKANQLKEKLRKQTDEQGDSIEGLSEALEQISRTLNQILDFDSTVRLSINEIDIEPIFMKAATFLINEEIETSLEYQGSGVQRALAFAILESNAEIESEVQGEHRSIVVLYEEPELYIHPHLMRRLKEALQKRSLSKRWQVVCSTHSPFLIDIADKPKSLKLLKRSGENQRIVHQVGSDIFELDGDYDERSMLRATLDFHPTVCEAFFAKRVVLVEGDTEVAVFSLASRLVEKLEIRTILVPDTTVISAGGKWTIPAIVKVLKGLGIQCKVIHDEDRKGRDDDVLDSLPSLDPYRANAKISEVAGEGNVYVVQDTFEDVLWEEGNRSRKDKPYKAWKRLGEYLSGTGDITGDSKRRLTEVIKFAFDGTEEASDDAEEV